MEKLPHLIYEMLGKRLEKYEQDNGRSAIDVTSAK